MTRSPDAPGRTRDLNGMEQTMKNIRFAYAGLLLLLVGYVCLAVPAETSSEWLLLRVVGGFVLLFVGFSVAIGPTVTALLGHHD